MRRFQLLFLFLGLLNLSLSAQSPFITIWQTDNPGMSGSTSITIPTDPGEIYNYSVSVPSIGYSASGITSDHTINFGSAGNYTVEITGQFPRIFFNYDESNAGSGGDRLKLIQIEQWGTISWNNLDSAFAGCWNLIKVNTPDVPDLKNLSTLRYTFYDCYQLPEIQGINSWDVANITDIQGLFALCVAFNGDVSSWNTSQVTDMSELFGACQSFNQDISGWDVGKVTNMTGLFAGCRVFNQDLSGWRVDLVTGMGRMFSSAVLFDSDISSWNTAMCTDMSRMFNNADAFSHDITGWNVGKVTNMESMFNFNDNFNQDISGWDVSNVTNMDRMFRQATTFDQNLGSWNISNLTTASEMFDGSLMNLNYDATIIGWSSKMLQNNVTMGASGLSYCVAEVARQSIIDRYAWTFDGDVKACPDNFFVTTWKTDNPGTSCNSCVIIPVVGVTSNFDVDWNNDGTFDDLNVTNSITHDFGVPGTYTISIRGSIRLYHALATDDGDKLLSVDQWGSIEWSDMSDAFSYCGNLVVNATDIPNFNTVQNMHGMFEGCTNLVGDFSDWYVGAVEDMSNMFTSCSQFNSDISGWDVSSVANMSYMFGNASSFDGDISLWHVKASNFSSMFLLASSFDHNLGLWDVSNALNMQNMFDNSGMSVTSYDGTLIGWSGQVVNTGVTVGGNLLGFCQAEAERQSLIDNFSWIFVGDQKDCSQDNPFITTWQTDNNGSSCSQCVTIGTFGSGYYYDVDWENDGIFDDFNIIGNITHDYGTPGTYTVAIKGRFPRFSMNNSQDTAKLMSIDQWGGIYWSTLEDAFFACPNLVINASDVPDLSGVSNLNSTFWNCPSLDYDFRQWDFSGITSMDHFLSLTALSITNYDSLLIHFDNTTVQSGISFGAIGLEYCQGATARDNLISGSGWTFSGDGLNCHDSRPCTFTYENTWVGPNVGVAWNVSSTYWSLGSIPQACHKVVIPPGNLVIVPAGYVAECHSIEVEGYGLDVQAGGELNVWVE